MPRHSTITLHLTPDLARALPTVAVPAPELARLMLYAAVHQHPHPYYPPLVTLSTPSGYQWEPGVSAPDLRVTVSPTVRRILDRWLPIGGTARFLRFSLEHYFFASPDPLARMKLKPCPWQIPYPHPQA